MTKTVLAFGHIPKSHGGRQQSGLANAMWSIASNMADPISGFNVVFCATDMRARSIEIDGVEVVGWTKRSLLGGILRHLGQSIKLLARLSRVCSRYDLPLARTTLKALHLQNVIDRTAPDFLHLHGCDAVVLLEAGIFDPQKTLVTIHGLHGASGPPRLGVMEAKLNKLSLRGLVFVSAQNMREWGETYGPSISPQAAFPNAFDREEFFLAEGARPRKGGHKASYRLVSIGSVSENKGQHRVIEALGRFQALGISHVVEYIMIGDGAPPVVARLLAQAADAGILVSHLPYLSPTALREQVSQADFMILPTANEGFGLVFLESIACGVPVVLPKGLPICAEPGLLSAANAVFLESSSADAVLEFLANLPLHSFVAAEVASSLPQMSWKGVGARYRELLSAPT